MNEVHGQCSAGICRLLIVDPGELARRLLADYLGRQHGITLVGDVRGAEEAIELAQQYRPHVALVDTELSGLNSFEGARRMMAVSACTRIAFLFTNIRDRDLEEAVRQKPAGYLTKFDGPETVRQGILRVAAGEIFVSDALRSRLVMDQEGKVVGIAVRSNLSQLTDREAQILRYIASGMAHRQIAATMKISVKTVDTHCDNLMRKLGIHDRVELARLAIREGLVDA